MLAELLKSGFLPESYRAPDKINRLRGIVRERAYLVRLRISAKNRIHGVLTRAGVHTMKHSPKHKLGQDEIREEGDTELSRLRALSNDLSQRIEPLDAKIKALGKGMPLVKLLKTMPGVGTMSASTARRCPHGPVP